MKYIIAVADGCADLPTSPLGTPLHYAHTPCLDALASKAQLGRTCLIPSGYASGTLPALLTLLGAPKETCSSSRAALEALGLGARLAQCAAFRCNLISLQEGRITAHDGGGMSQHEADELIASLSVSLGDAAHTFISGITYRAFLLRQGAAGVDSPPPDTLLGQSAEAHLPNDTDLRRLFYAAHEILSAHPINTARQANGKLPINAIWFWGGGTLPSLPTFYDRTGIQGSAVGGVPLVHGIAKAMGLFVVPVPHANGTLHTNWEGKAFAALDALEQTDFVFVHAEAPDEAGHTGSFRDKVTAIEYFDQRLLTPLVEGLAARYPDYRILILSDHPTPVSLRRHTIDPVPWMLYDSRKAYTGGIFEENETLPLIAGTQLLDLLLERISS